MKKWWIGWIVLAVLILLYLFYPLCSFKRIGSSYKDDCNTCWCGVIGPTCTLLACIPECVKEGESGNVELSPDLKCCEGLDTKSKYDENCIALPNMEFICINCGNGVCGAGENKCNCPEDCGTSKSKEEVIEMLCKNITEENQYLSKCKNGMYIIETIVGEGGRISYYDAQGNFVENAIREDVPIFVTNSGKKTHCITDSGEECPDYDCSVVEC